MSIEFIDFHQLIAFIRRLQEEDRYYFPTSTYHCPVVQQEQLFKSYTGWHLMCHVHVLAFTLTRNNRIELAGGWKLAGDQNTGEKMERCYEYD